MNAQSMADFAARASSHGYAVHWIVVKYHSMPVLVFLAIAFGPFIPAALLAKVRYGIFRLSERFYEWRFGISSDGEILMDEFGITDGTCHHYLATGYRRFRQLMRLITIRAGEDVFLDFGSGMGRAIVLAATFPFRKVIGVELVRELHSVAEENVRRARPRLRCRDIELYNTDARKFRIPPEVTVIYLWNPFSGDVLAEVIRNIRGSVLESPRTVTILHLSPESPTYMDEIKDRFPWLKENKRVHLGAQSLAVVYTVSATVLNTLNEVIQLTS